MRQEFGCRQRTHHVEHRPPEEADRVRLDLALVNDLLHDAADLAGVHPGHRFAVDAYGRCGTAARCQRSCDCAQKTHAKMAKAPPGPPPDTPPPPPPRRFFSRDGERERRTTSEKRKWIRPRDGRRASEGRGEELTCSTAAIDKPSSSPTSPSRAPPTISSSRPRRARDGCSSRAPTRSSPSSSRPPRRRRRTRPPPPLTPPQPPKKGKTRKTRKTRRRFPPARRSARAVYDGGRRTTTGAGEGGRPPQPSPSPRTPAGATIISRGRRNRPRRSGETIGSAAGRYTCGLSC